MSLVINKVQNSFWWCTRRHRKCWNHIGKQCEQCKKYRVPCFCSCVFGVGSNNSGCANWLYICVGLDIGEAGLSAISLFIRDYSIGSKLVLLVTLESCLVIETLYPQILKYNVDESESKNPTNYVASSFLGGKIAVLYYSHWKQLIPGLFIFVT